MWNSCLYSQAHIHTLRSTLTWEQLLCWGLRQDLQGGSELLSGRREGTFLPSAQRGACPQSGLLGGGSLWSVTPRRWGGCCGREATCGADSAGQRGRNRSCWGLCRSPVIARLLFARRGAEHSLIWFNVGPRPVREVRGPLAGGRPGPENTGAEVRRSESLTWILGR